MQKTEKSPKRSTGSSRSALLEKAPNLQQTIFTPQDFRELMVKTIQHYDLITQEAQAKISEPTSEQLKGLQYIFEKLPLEGEQLISVAQSALAHLSHTQAELEKDSQVQQDEPSQQDLANTQQILNALQHWLRQYQGQMKMSKQFVSQRTFPLGYSSPQASRPTSPSSMADGVTSSLSSHAASSSTSPIDINVLLQEYINALNVTTVSAFLRALQNLNQFLNANPSIPISMQQFYSLFNQLDKTLQILPENTQQGLPQRQIVASMIAVNRQTNQLYGFLMGRQII